MKVLLIFGFLFGASFFANAWWDDGHRKVCELALENISSKKREEIEILIGVSGQTLSKGNVLRQGPGIILILLEMISLIPQRIALSKVVL